MRTKEEQMAFNEKIMDEAHQRARENSYANTHPNSYTPSNFGPMVNPGFIGLVLKLAFFAIVAGISVLLFTNAIGGVRWLANTEFRHAVHEIMATKGAVWWMFPLPVSFLVLRDWFAGLDPHVTNMFWVWLGVLLVLSWITLQVIVGLLMAPVTLLAWNYAAKKLGSESRIGFFKAWGLSCLLIAFRRQLGSIKNHWLYGEVS
jgi:hypothetical protein